MLFNCSARIEMGATTYDPVGNTTEVAFIKFLQDANIPVHLHIKQKVGRVKMVGPFNSMTKRSVTVMINPNRPNTVTWYLKGAPETVIDYCSAMHEHVGIQELTPEKAEQIRSVVDLMAEKPLRVLAFAYCEMDIETWQQFVDMNKDLETIMDERSVSFTFLGAFGLHDPLRKNVKSVVKAV